MTVPGFDEEEGFRGKIRMYMPASSNHADYHGEPNPTGMDPQILPASLSSGCTPLYIAIDNGHRDRVEALLKRGADPEKKCGTEGRNFWFTCDDLAEQGMLGSAVWKGLVTE
jgi:hypothetical protein